MICELQEKKTFLLSINKAKVEGEEGIS